MLTPYGNQLTAICWKVQPPGVSPIGNTRTRASANYTLTLGRGSKFYLAKRVNLVSAGGIQTGLFSRFLGSSNHRRLQSTHERLRIVHHLGKAGQSGVAATLVRFCHFVLN